MATPIVLCLLSIMVLEAWTEVDPDLHDPAPWIEVDPDLHDPAPWTEVDPDLHNPGRWAEEDDGCCLLGIEEAASLAERRALKGWGWTTLLHYMY